MTRILVVAGLLAASTLLGGWGFDRQGPWCLFDPDSTNCGFPSWAACMETASGAGGYCAENPRFVDVPPARRRHR